MKVLLMNSCHKVVRSIRITTLKLSADCAKQFVRKAQKCRKTNHEFYTILTHQLSHWCLCVSVWPKTKPLSCLNHRIRWTWSTLTFPVPKTADTDERKVFCYNWGDKKKSKQKLLAIPRSSFQKCFENWKKRKHKCILTEGVTLKGTGELLINKSIHFEKNWK